MRCRQRAGSETVVTTGEEERCGCEPTGFPAAGIGIGWFCARTCAAVCGVRLPRIRAGSRTIREEVERSL